MTAPVTPPLHWLSAQALGAKLRAGECSSVDATEALLARIAALDPALHAFVHVLGDGARADAARADDELRGGRDRGPLHGVPLAIKDLCAVRGLPTAAGTRVLADRVATEDACVVARLRDAGAVLLGTVVMTEGAYAAHHPSVTPPRNPWDATRWSGISSSGSGVATAAGLCFGALGTDTGGSIRMPSAANGIVGLKPTYGRIPRHGVFPLAASLDHVGPLTRSAWDAASILGAIAGHDRRDPTSLHAPVPSYTADIAAGLAGVRIGIDERYAGHGIDDAIAAAVLASTATFRAAGAEVRAVCIPPWEEILIAWTIVCGVEAALSHTGLFPERRDEYGPVLAGLLDLGRALPGVDLARALALGREFSGRLADVFTEVDLLLCPTLGMRLPEALPNLADVELILAVLRFTAPFNFSGNPTLSLPCGFTLDGLPVSLELVGRHLEEALLCRAGHVFETATDWHTRHPAL